MAIPSLFVSSACVPQGEKRAVYPVEVETNGRKVILYDESHVLLIGVSNYTNGWRKLPGVIQDIKEVQTVLEKHGFKVELLLNPIGDDLNKAIKKFIGKYGILENNRLLIYFAGHGATLPTMDGRGEQGYIVPADAPLPSKGIGPFIEVAISMDDIESYALKIQSKHVLFVFDSCFSGSLFEAMRSEDVPTYAITDKSANPVRLFITSGTAEQQVPDKSIFREQFVEALNGAADLDKDGYITGTELGEFLHNQVTHYSEQAQTPRYGKIRNSKLDKGDFVFSLRTVGNAGSPLVRAFEFDVVLLDRNGKETSRRKEEATSLIEDLGNGVTMEMVKIPGGTFLMGTSEEEAGQIKKDFERYEASVENTANYVKQEIPQHQVTVPAFYMSKFEVTQSQWQAIASLQKVNKRLVSSSSKYEGEKLPVEQVSWEDTNEFCARLSQRTGRKYRLPTEAEWEYACRAGTMTPFSFGETITPELVNYNGNYPFGSAPKGIYRERTSPVGSLGAANAFGLYDMHGNVSEWCMDIWHDNYNGAPTDGSAWEKGGDENRRVIRGGSWYFSGSFSRSANRHKHFLDHRDSDLGFRVVVTDLQRSHK